MTKTIDKAKKVLELISSGFTVQDARKSVCSDNYQEWCRVSAKAYRIHHQNSRKQRQIDEKKSSISFTSNAEIERILTLNVKLADFALTLPPFATMHDFRLVNNLAIQMPNLDIEHTLISTIGDMIMSANYRSLQKKGRFEHFGPFKEFSRIIDAATICYYRENYISAFLTLVPVVEGVMLRWLNYEGIGTKPEFEELRGFFQNSHKRQPYPGNPLFYDVYIKSCNKILTDHLYKPTERGASYSNFSRHLAAHLLNNSQFATKENCIRLFLLIDLMTQIYHYETRCVDPRFGLENSDIVDDYNTFHSLITNQSIAPTPEQKFLGHAT